ncbi:UDP-2,3-diacylglucosamine diphosphatase [Reinekea thalattae]|uniref:UDP-2,3-diacylglucosamine hydrolase n=1 Tax=Reinekea thalattae TaxID=2593301 RepID=A0A5C8Z898_9GAMM|nr:UDP-2,3-diacylglucosamine diphosphatase [Reinekea thalattae]TXR53549.1 UDP-2,3-diacylglucosamine diphosphatase [Reinekea thalattae]
MSLNFTNALFISDIHLTENRPDCVRAFFDFIEWVPASTEALFILGDFFEYWLGDDINSELSEQVANALSQLAKQKSVQIFYMAGNRDFALGEHYCKLCSMSWLEDGTLATIDGLKVYLSHGDLFCTDDKSYQRFRKIIRHPVVLFLLRRSPKAYRKNLAAKLRAKSKQKYQQNPTFIDVTNSAISHTFKQSQCDLIIHGHTHMADIHVHNYKPQQLRMVLGDWDQVGWYGSIEQQQPQLTQFSIENPSF